MSWNERFQPLEPIAVLGVGTAARALARALVRRAPDDIAQLRAVDAGTPVEGGRVPVITSDTTVALVSPFRRPKADTSNSQRMIERSVGASRATARVILILGLADRLPWADGAHYLGRDPENPGLLLPTAVAPSVPPGLLVEVLGLQSLAAITPVEGGRVLAIPVDGALPLTPGALERFLAVGEEAA